MNGLHELPLVIFTVFAQATVGAFLLFSLVLCTTKDVHYRHYVHKAMFVLLALLGIGFIASITHLGSPMRAFNSLNRVGESMLSNEIATGSLFFVLASLYWLLAILDKIPKLLGNLWLILTALMGVVFMYMMNQVYHIITVPTWYNAFTSWNFYLTIVLAGFPLAYALLHNLRPDSKIINWVPVILIITTLLAAIVAIYQGFNLNDIHTSVQKASDLVPDFAWLTAIRLTLLGIAILLLFAICKKPNIIIQCIAILLAISAELIGRTLFYGLHMTVGTAIGG